MPEATITSGWNVGETNDTCGATRLPCSQPVPALIPTTTDRRRPALPALPSAARPVEGSQTRTIGRASSGSLTEASTGERQIGNRMPASIALATGVGIRVIARVSAGQKPVIAMRAPQTTNAPTAAAKLWVVACAAIRGGTRRRPGERQRHPESKAQDDRERRLCDAKRQQAGCRLGRACSDGAQPGEHEHKGAREPGEGADETGDDWLDDEPSLGNRRDRPEAMFRSPICSVDLSGIGNEVRGEAARDLLKFDRSLGHREDQVKRFVV